MREVEVRKQRGRKPPRTGEEGLRPIDMFFAHEGRLKGDDAFASSSRPSGYHTYLSEIIIRMYYLIKQSRIILIPKIQGRVFTETSASKYSAGERFSGLIFPWDPDAAGAPTRRAASPSSSLSSL